jgi:outer membrane protein
MQSFLRRYDPRAQALRATLLCAVALMAAPIRAEDLAQVYELARAHDAALLAAKARASAAVPRAAQARAAWRPNLSATGTSTWSRFDPSVSASNTSGEALDSRDSSLALNLRQPLYNRAASADIAIADVVQEIARLDFEISSQDFILRVAQAYFDVLSAQDLLATQRQSKLSFGEQLEWAQRRFQAGLAIITDQQDAQARYDLAESQEVAAENTLRARRLGLDRLTGRPGIRPNVRVASHHGSE